MHKFTTAVMSLALLGQPALASQTACTFSASKAPRYYELEFIGYGDASPLLVFSSTTFGAGKRIPLPSANYTLKHFSQKARRVHIEFRNPQDRALPPSFTLAGTGDRVWLTIGSVRIQGALQCDH